MKKRHGLFLVTLFMALMLSGKGAWQIHLSNIHILFNVNQSSQAASRSPGRIFYGHTPWR